MRRLNSMLALITLTCLVGGCSNDASSPTSNAGNNRPSDPVAQVVHDFWDAVRVGKVTEATALLTPTAQARLAKEDYVFVPPASDTMRFEIGKVELAEGGQAVVDSVWSDVDGDGKRYRENMSLALRQVDGQWRIFGMAAEAGPGQEPLIMDLENPDDFFSPTTPAATAQAPASGDPPVRQAQQPATDPFR